MFGIDIMPNKSKYDWVEVQKLYDSGASVMECCRKFGFDKALFWQSCRRGKIVKDKSRERAKFNPSLDITGKDFFNLTVIGKAEKYQVGRGYIWRCKCSCGNETLASTRDLNAGGKKSCGCLKKRKSHSHWKWRGYEGISMEFFGGIRSSCSHRAKGRQIQFSVTMQFLWELYLNQNRRCAISGEEIILCPERELRTASLDRIDSSCGYTNSNVQWVHKDVNIMKSSFSMDKFLSWVALIHKNKAR